MLHGSINIAEYRDSTICYICVKSNGPAGSPHDRCIRKSVAIVSITKRERP